MLRGPGEGRRKLWVGGAGLRLANLILHIRGEMDDLFGDLPPPSSLSGNGTTSVAQPSLFGDLPPASGGEKGEGGLGKHPLEAAVDDQQAGGKEAKHQKLSSAHYQLKGYLGERRGEREDMQDAHTIIDDFTPQFTSLPNNISRVAYYGVFDGHAGPRASKFTAEHLHKNIVAKFPRGEVQNLDREVKKCLIEVFKKTDEDFLQKASSATPSWKDGSTVATVLVLNDTIYSANLGDSKAILCRRSQEGKLSFVALTKDHNPSNFEERKRIEKSGGTVRYVLASFPGPTQLGNEASEGRVMGIVEVSRSIGDGRFKHCGVISTPDVFRCQLTENDLFILIACDGLWKAFSVEEAAKFIITVLEDECIQLPEDDERDTNFESRKPTSVRDVRCEEACNRIAVEAVKRGCTDNVTVMIVDIMHPL